MEAAVRETWNVGSGPQGGDCGKYHRKKAPPTKLKKKSSPETKSFAEAVVGTKHEVPSGVGRVSVGEEEVVERLRKLSCFLVGCGVEEPRRRQI